MRTYHRGFLIVLAKYLEISAVNWYQTYKNFLKGLCGRPKRKKKSDSGSIHLTRELFRFEKCEDGVTRLFIGSKTNNIGFLSIKNHASYPEPKSIYSGCGATDKTRGANANRARGKEASKKKEPAAPKNAA